MLSLLCSSCIKIDVKTKNLISLPLSSINRWDLRVWLKFSQKHWCQGFDCSLRKKKTTQETSIFVRLMQMDNSSFQTATEESRLQCMESFFSVHGVFFFTWRLGVHWIRQNRNIIFCIISILHVSVFLLKDRTEKQSY